MPFVDLERAKREVLGGGHEEYTFAYTGGQSHTFPSHMPAAVEIEQSLAERERKRRGLDSMPDDLVQKQVRVTYGEAEYERLLEAGVPETELMLAFGVVMTDWLAPYSDPQMPARILEWAKTGGGPASKIPNTESSTPGHFSKPTGNGNMESTSPPRYGEQGGPSTVADLVPGVSGRSPTG